MDGIREEDLLDGLWSLHHSSGVTATTGMRFMADGGIAGYSHPNEAAWRCEDGVLLLLTDKGVISSRFDQIERVDGRLERLSGPYLLDEQLGITFTIARQSARPARDLPTSTRALLAKQSAAYGWNIGEHSYGKPLVYAIDGTDKLTIGRFCSIGHDVTIVLVNHRTDLVTTYPFATLRQHWDNVPDVKDMAGKGDVVIGNDVWIGHGAFIGSGINIGHGAIVGGHAVVTRDVPPYSIVGGNPSRILKYRHDHDVIDKLLEIAWWDWPENKLERFLPLLMSTNIDAFIEAAET